MIHGKEPTLLNVTYIRPDRKRGIEEAFEVIYKDDSGAVHKSNEPAEVTIYFVKPECRDFNYNKPQERMERLFPKRVLVSEIKYEIAKEIGEEGKKFVEQCAQAKDWKALNRLYGWRYAFKCDFQPEFYFMQDWYEKYPLKTVKLSKSFLDIETDIIDHIPDLEKLNGSAYSPVNLATLFLEETKEMVTFALRPYKPSHNGRTEAEYKERYALYEMQSKSHKELMENLPAFYDRLQKEFEPVYGYANYSFREYENEIDLIADIFRLINDRKPNFNLTWNMRFDIQYLLERTKVLGYDPASIMCHPDFENQKCYFHVDRMLFQIEKQYDYFYCASYTQYICLMRLYASIRKSQQMLKSVSLNAIGDRELKDKKVEYPANTRFMDFAYIDWLLFILYNIKDVWIMVGIERKTNDVMTYYSKSHSNLTPYAKIFRETHLLRNVREKYFNEDGWVQANNLNIIGLDEEELFDQVEGSEDDDEGEATFKGAIMADPVMNDNVGIHILGSPTNNVFENAMDYDMAAFYPSIKIASNMDPGTLLYKAELNNQDFISGEKVNRSLNQTYQERDKHGKLRNQDITGEAVNTYVSGNILTFGYNYLNFPDVSEMMRDVLKELKD